MREINIAKTLVAKRKQKGITQDELAEYIGVSKASVSKWETSQSFPDITFLPRLAAYFNITIDELIGYEPQMEKVDIKKLYHRLAGDFAAKPFGEVLSECREVIRKYFSCFPLLLQMAGLFANHFMLADTTDKQKEILGEAISLCRRVRTESEDVLLSRDAVYLEATCRLMLQEPKEILNLLGEDARLLVSDIKLIGYAHQLLGNHPKAIEVTQIGMYQHLMILADLAPTYLMMCATDVNRTDEIVRRSIALAEAYHLDQLNPNTMLQTYISAASAYCMQGNTEKALDMLQKYTELCISGFFPFRLHGDDYFDFIGAWFESFDLGPGAPRSEKFIKESMLQGVAANPMFSILKDHPRFMNLTEKLKSQIGGN